MNEKALQVLQLFLGDCLETVPEINQRKFNREQSMQGSANKPAKDTGTEWGRAGLAALHAKRLLVLHKITSWT